MPRDLCDLSDRELDEAVANAVPMPPVAPLPDCEDNHGGNGVYAATPVGEPVEPLKLITLDDSPPQPTQWIVGGVLPEEACMVVAAEEKTGKSWLLFDLAICIASGEKLLGQWEPRRTGKVIVYSPESGWNAKKQRLWGLCWARGLDPVQVLKSVLFIPCRLDLSKQEMVEGLKATIAAEQPVALILDPLITTYLGLDENSSNEIQPLLNSIRDLGQASPGMAILVAHHLSKGHRDRSAFHGLRGSSAIGAWADGRISIRKAKPEPDSPRRVDVEHRDAQPPSPVGFTINQVYLGDLPEGLFGFRLNPCEPPEIGSRSGSKPTKLDPDIQVKVFQLVTRTSGTLTRSAGARELKMERNKFNRYFKHLEERGLTRRTGNGLMESIGSST